MSEKLTIEQNLSLLLETKTKMKKNIIASGGTINDDTPFIEYAKYVGGSSEGGASGYAIEVSTHEEMGALLVEANLNKLYKYVGESDDTYVNGQYYIIVESDTVQFQPLSAGSGVVKIERKGTGIQEVPNSGLVEKLVFNTELTTSEVDTIISNANLTFVDFEGMPVYPIFVNEENEIGIIIVNYGALIGDGTIAYLIMEFGNGLNLYNSSVFESESGFDGWNMDLFEQLGGGNEFPANMEANPTFNGLAVGSQNDAIKDIINVGGVEPYLKELSGTYEPIDLEITENTTIDLATQYMDNKQMPVSLNVQTTRGTIDITDNGEHDVSKYEKANVNVQPNLQYKSLSLTSTSLTINPDSGYDGLSQVRVDVTSNIDSDIKAENIKKGVNILNVVGTYTGAQDYYNENVIEIVHNQYASFDVFKSYNAPNLTKIGIGAFKGCTSLETFNFNNNIMEIGHSAFMNCRGLYGNLVIPSLITQIEEQTFMKTNYSTVDLNNVTEIKLNAFAKCENLETISNGDKIAKIGQRAFFDTTKLKSINFPNITYIDDEAFQGAFLNNINVENVKHIGECGLGCGLCEIISLPNLETMGNMVFQMWSNLKELNLPKLQEVSAMGVYMAQALEKVDLGVCTKIGDLAFSECSSLTTLIIRTTSQVCELFDISALAATPIESGTGYVYVPDELVDQYKAATNWSTYANQIKPLSEYVE